VEKYSFHRVNLGQNKEEHYEEESDSDTDCKRTGAVNRGMDSG